MENRTTNSIGGIAIAIAIIVTAVLAGLRVDQYLKNQAFTECSELASFSTQTKGKTDNGQEYVTTSKEPVRKLFKACIEDKGYSTQIK